MRTIDPKKEVLAHQLVAKIAGEAAEELYELVMGDNSVREAWKKQNPGCGEKELVRRFRKKNAGKCVGFARATLAQMLTDPRIDESFKMCIHEALVLDAQLPGRTGLRPAIEMRGK